MDSHLSSEGSKGFLPFDSTIKSYTRADMHRGDSIFKGTGTVTRFLAGTHSVFVSPMVYEGQLGVNGEQ